MKGFSCCNNSLARSGSRPGDAEITAALRWHRYTQKKKAKSLLTASDSVCGDIIQCREGDKHQRCASKHILNDLYSFNEEQERQERELKQFQRRGLSRHERRVEQTGRRAAIWPTLSFRLEPQQPPAAKTILTGRGNEMFTVRV